MENRDRPELIDLDGARQLRPAFQGGPGKRQIADSDWKQHPRSIAPAAVTTPG
jgi:hypothetical protein